MNPILLIILGIWVFYVAVLLAKTRRAVLIIMAVVLANLAFGLFAIAYVL